MLFDFHLCRVYVGVTPGCASNAQLRCTTHTLSRIPVEANPKRFTSVSAEVSVYERRDTLIHTYLTFFASYSGDPKLSHACKQVVQGCQRSTIHAPVRLTWLPRQLVLVPPRKRAPEVACELERGVQEQSCMFFVPHSFVQIARVLFSLNCDHAYF